MMQPSRMLVLPALVLSGVLTLAACGDEDEVAEAPVAEEADVVPAGPVGATAEPAFDPVLDVNRDGILGADEGLGDADGDGILDRDEAYPATE